MATPQEIQEVQKFLQKYDGEWLTSDDDSQSELPSLSHRLTDDSDVLWYHVNSVCDEAGLPGGIEEHGYNDWLVTNNLENNMSIESLEILAKSDSTLFAEAIKKHGLQVIGTRESDPLQTQVQEELVSAMASAITEDINDNTELTAVQRAIYQLAEEYGYIVQVL